MILHGWPDAPRGWSQVARLLQSAGYRTITPYLRGLAPTRFLSPRTPRVGSGVALAQDAVDLADALRLDRFFFVGHDWGARVAYTLAALFPERIRALVALSLGFQPRGIFEVPDFDQSRRFWYQWFLCTEGGAKQFASDPVGFARIQWDTWSPSGWFDDAEFAATAASFSNPDWIATTLNAYRARWVSGEADDSLYDALQSKLSAIERLSSPSLMIQGGSDYCDDPKESESQENFFTQRYERLLLEGVGHFPHRESAVKVAQAIIRWFQSN